MKRIFKPLDTGYPKRIAYLCILAIILMSDPVRIQLRNYRHIISDILHVQ